MTSRLLLTASFVAIVSLGFGQTGSIKGRVTDGVTGEGIVAASLYVMPSGETTQALGAVADMEGNFAIHKVKAGKHKVVVSFVSYKSDTLEVDVYPDQTTMVNPVLVEESQQLSEIVVSGTRVTNTDFAVITEIKKNDLIAVGISAQQIKLSQDRDAAQIIRRLPGVTIVGNRFVNVRGLSERYSTVMLNGVIAPSSEVDSKAFAFDLIPSSLIDRMMVYKSGAAELPGEFAGAIIGIHTKSIVEENSLSISLTGGVRAGTTFKSVTSYKGSSTDWLGYDDGLRQLPAEFPNENLRIYESSPSNENNNKLIAATKSLPNTWSTTPHNVTPDLRFNLDFSHAWLIGTKKITNITSLSYSKVNQNINSNLNYYEAFDETTQKSNVRYNFYDKRYGEQSRVGAISNFTFEISPVHKIEFRNFFNQQGVKQTTTRTGVEVMQNADVNNLAMNYTSRGIYSGQLQGTHSLSDHFKVTWIGGYSQTKADQPDYRRIRSQRPAGTDDPFMVVIPPGASLLDAGRFYSDLIEKVYTASLNMEWKFNPQVEEDRQSKIMVGGYVEDKNRDFTARWMSYKWINSNVIDLELLKKPFDEIFVDENLGTKFILTEGTNEGPSLYDEYRGKSQLYAGYVSAAIPFADHFRLVGGFRLEDFRQQIDVSSFGTVIPNLVNNKTVNPLPFVNLSYNITEKMLLRAAYSHTVNRPVFREIAPFQFYDFDRTADILGNPTLKTADIHNVDLKWEFYPTKNENITVGAFYKKFKNPIELFFEGNQNIAYTYEQAEGATSLGVEAEVRKSLSGLTSVSFINNLSLIFNAALIKSEIIVPNGPEFETQIKNRALQGQSPYVINAGLTYQNLETGIQASLMYNVYGQRIYAVGDLLNNRTQYEMPKNLLDFTLSKQLGSKLELKLGIQDILNQAYRIYQDANQNEKIDAVDEPITNFKTGQYFSLGAALRIY